MATPNPWILSALAWLAFGAMVARKARRPWGASVFFSGTAAMGLLAGKVMDGVNLVEIAYVLGGFATMLVLPRLARFREEVSGLLGIVASGLAVIGFDDPRLCFLGLLAGALVARGPRAFRIYETLGLVAFVAAEVLLEMHQLFAAGLCFAVAALIRQGVPPFQTGLLSLAREGGIDCVQAALLAPTGIAVFSKHALPALQLADTHAWEMGIVSLLTLSALYMAILSVAQERLSRLAQTAPSVVGALVMAMAAAGARNLNAPWVLLMVGGIGLSLVARIADSRSEDGAVPALAGYLLVFALALGGLPGTLGFVAEEGLEHTLLEVSGLHLSLALAAIALTTVALYRAYTRLFLGNPLPAEVGELSGRERWGLATLAAMLVGLGILG